MQRFWAIMTVVFLLQAGLVMAAIIEGWFTIETMQELAKWVCVTVVAMGLSIISWLGWRTRSLIK